MFRSKLNTSYFFIVVVAILVAVAVLLMVTPKKAHATEDNVDLGTIVLSPNRIEESVGSIGKSVDVITANEMQTSGYDRAMDNLEDLPGVRVKQADDLGGLTTIRIRGLRSIDTKATLNGLPFHDPSDPQGSANPFYEDIESGGLGKIELTRGTGSVLWGSDAQSGVVAMYTKKGSGDPRANGGFEFGSRGTFKEYADVEGAKDGFDFYVRGSRTDSDGMDAHDGYDNTGVTSRFGYQFENGAKIEFTQFGYKASGALKNSPQVLGGVVLNDSPDENDRRENLTQNYGFHVETPLGDKITLNSRVGFTDSNRRFEFLPNSDGSGFFNDGGYEGQDLIFDNQIDVKHNDALHTTVGWQHEVQWQVIEARLTPDDDEKAKSQTYSDDYYMQEHFSLDEGKWVSTLGTRESNPAGTKSRATWDASTSYKLFPDTRLKAHAGTAYRAPSLFERYGAFLTSFGTFSVGNPTLSPERSKGYDFGIEQGFLDGSIIAGSTFFRHDLVSQIDFVGAGYENIDGQGHTLGVENFLELDPRQDIKVRLSHTYTQRLERGTGMFDIPRNSFGGEVLWKSGKWTASTRANYIGSRIAGIFDNDTFLTDMIPEKAYTKVDATLSYELKKGIEIYGRIENLFDAQYTESGFRAPGTGFFAGVRTEF